MWHKPLILQEFSSFNKTKISSIFHTNFTPPKPKFGTKGKLMQNFSYERGMYLYKIEVDTNDKEFFTRKNEHNFDIISQPKHFYIYLENTSLTNIKLNSISKISCSGIEILGVNDEDIFKVKQFRKITIKASNIGDIELNGIINFIFDNSKIISIAVKGARIVVFSYKPNFGYSESKTYKTQIFCSQNGHETRKALRKYPLREVKFTITTKEIENMALQTLCFAQNRELMLPLWFSATPILKDGYNDNMIDCNIKEREFIEGGFMLIWESFSKFQFAKIVKLNQNFIQIDKKLDFKQGNLAIALMKATPENSINYSNISSGVAKINLAFRELS